MEIRLRALLPLFFLVAVISQRGTAQCSLNPSLFLGNDTIRCEGSLLDAGSGYVSHTWQNASTGQTFAADTTGWKFVTVTDSFGCTGTDSIFLTVQQRPVAQITPDSNQVLCLGDTLFLESLSPGIFAYLWNDSITSSNHQVIDSGSFFVIVFDNLGCTDTSETIHVTALPKPIINIIPPGPYNLCAGDTLYVTTVSPEHLAYLWNDGYTSGDRFLTSTGSYQVRIQDYNGCYDTSSTIHVLFNPLPVVDLGPDDTLCTGETITLDAGIFNAYLWSNGATTQTTNITAQGGYGVQVTDNNGCVGTDVIQITEIYAPQVNIGLDRVLCGNNILWLDAGSGFASYLWSNGHLGQQVLINTPGAYFVTVVSAATGCQGTSNTVTVTGDTNTVVPISFINLVLTTTSFTTYQWYKDLLPVSGANNIDYTPTEGGNYFVTVTTPNGCVLSSDTILVILTITKESIPQGFSPNGDANNDFFYIPGLVAYPNNEMVIFNRWGSEVFRQSGYVAHWAGKNSNGDDLEEGTYFYTLDLGNGKDSFSGYIMIRR